MANPKISDFSHLFGDDAPDRKLMTIDFEQGIFHADTPEEGRTMAEIVAKMVEARKTPQNSTHPSCSGFAIVQVRYLP